MFTYAITVALATAVAARTMEETSPSRRWRWLAAIALTSGLATVFAVRALQQGRIPSLVLVLTVAVAYVTWPLVSRPTTRPHWTVAAAAAAAVLQLVGYGALAVLTSGWLWGDVVLTLVGLTIVAVASLAWGVVGSLWLRHRARLDASAATAFPVASDAIAALPAVPDAPALPSRAPLTALPPGAPLAALRAGSTADA